MEDNNSKIEDKEIQTINTSIAKQSEIQDNEINFKNSARSQRSSIISNQLKDPRFIVITEPNFMIIRKIFSIDQNEYTEYEVKKKTSFINSFNKDTDLAKKINNLKLNTFFESFLFGNGNYYKIYMYLNFHLYDIDRAINNLYKFLEIVKKLKFNETELLHLINTCINEIQEGSSTMNNLNNITSLYTYSLDNFYQPIIAFDVPLLLLEKEKFKKKSQKEIFKLLLMKFNKIYSEELTPGKTEQINMFIDLGDISSKDVICIENFGELLKLFQLLFPSLIIKIFLSLNTTSKEVLNLIQNNIFQFYKDKLVAFDCTYNFKKIFEKYSNSISYEVFFNFFINKSGRKNSNNIFSENSFIEIKKQLDNVDKVNRLDKDQNLLNLETQLNHIENEFQQDNFTRNISNIKQMNTDRIFKKSSCYPNNKNLINNLETDSYTKEVLEACEVNSNFNITQSLAHAQSYRSYRNMNNSSWFRKSLSIESCNKFSINDLNEKKQINKFKITSCNNFTITETPSFSFEKIQMSRAQKGNPVREVSKPDIKSLKTIFEKNENIVCCGNSKEECVIF